MAQKKIKLAKMVAKEKEILVRTLNLIFFLLYPATQYTGLIVLAVRVSVHPYHRLSYIRLSVFSFPDGNLSKCQWIFIKLGVCVDIVEIWFGIVNGQILSIFDSYLPAICPIFFISG